jgi:large subunit ribosomal protein L30
MMIALVRIKGTVGVRKEIEDTFRILRLKSPNSCTLLPDNPSYKGMVKKVKDYSTFGKISYDMLLEMLKKRGRLEGNKRLDENTVKETGYDSIDKLAKDIFEDKVKMKDVKNLKPVFRLTPPSKGFRSTRLHYPKGDLGNRGEAINELLKRMI